MRPTQGVITTSVVGRELNESNGCRVLRLLRIVGANRFFRNVEIARGGIAGTGII